MAHQGLRASLLSSVRLPFASMMGDFEYNTDAIVAEYDSMAHLLLQYRSATDLPPVPRIIQTQFGLRPGPIFHQHPLVFLFL